jgi:hypothetical protein
VAITLGKDVSVSLGGNIASAKSATFSQTARTISIERYGSRLDEVYSTGRSATVSVTLNDEADSVALFSRLQSGEQITVSGGSGGWSFPAVVTSISESCSVDGVCEFTIEAQLTLGGLRT